MVYLEIAVVLLLILINGLLAMAELAVVSSRRARLQALVDRDIIGSRRALALASDPGRFLSTVQIGITLVGVLSGAISGATLGLRFAETLTSLGVPAGTAEVLAVAFVVAAITYASLIAGELVPKQIALRNPERVATLVAPAMTVLAKIASPLVTVLDASGRLMLRLLNQKAQPEQRVSDEEIRAVIAEAETAGVIEPGERQMIAGVMRLGDRRIRAVMTPRGEIDMIDLSADSNVIVETIRSSIHSRLPVHDGNSDEVLGVVQAKDLLNAWSRDGEPNIRALIRAAPMIPDTADAMDVVGLIKQSPVHVALILDEYGHFEGIVTNADILEAIVGSFRTDEDSPEPDAVQRDDGSWLISGSMAFDEMAERLGLPSEQRPGYNTAAGFVLKGFGQLPAIGNTFEANGWRFEVVDMDGRKVDRILATRLARPRRRAIL